MKLLPARSRRNPALPERGSMSRGISPAGQRWNIASTFPGHWRAAAHRAALRQRGMSLIECLVYIAVLAVVVSIALVCFNRCWDDNKHLRRNADDIVRALHAGEQWRADVRAATGDLRVTDQEGTETVAIPRPAGDIIYSYAHGELQRQAGPDSRATVVLDRIQSSAMQAQSHPHVTAWRWELALAPTQKNARMMPLFTFEAAISRPRP